VLEESVQLDEVQGVRALEHPCVSDECKQALQEQLNAIKLIAFAKELLCAHTGLTQWLRFGRN
jgi:hypothetical protein